MIAETTRQFVDNEVTPRIGQLEQHDWQLARDLVRQAADLGLIGANIPASYGGLGLDQTTGALIAENLGRSPIVCDNAWRADRNRVVAHYSLWH